jgi:hypothetical protein
VYHEEVCYHNIGIRKGFTSAGHFFQFPLSPGKSLGIDSFAGSLAFSKLPIPSFHPLQYCDEVRNVIETSLIAISVRQQFEIGTEYIKALS